MRQSNNNLESTTATEMGTELQYSNSEIHIGQNGSANTNNTNPAYAGRRRNGRYCIIYIHTYLRISII